MNQNMADAQTVAPARGGVSHCSRGFIHPNNSLSIPGGAPLPEWLLGINLRQTIFWHICGQEVSPTAPERQTICVTPFSRSSCWLGVEDKNKLR